MMTSRLSTTHSSVYKTARLIISFEEIIKKNLLRWVVNETIDHKDQLKRFFFFGVMHLFDILVLEKFHFLVHRIRLVVSKIQNVFLHCLSLVFW